MYYDEMVWTAVLQGGPEAVRRRRGHRHEEMLTGVRILPGGEGISEALEIKPENAPSIAGLRITTGCPVTEAPAPPEEY